MSRLFRLMLVLIAVHITLIGVAHLLTRDQHPAFLDLFTNPDGTPCDQPCLFGVRPGKMTIELATKIVGRHWLLSNIHTIATESLGSIMIADAGGEFAGHQFRVWLIPASSDEEPRITTAVVLGIMEPDQGLSSSFIVPITSSGTLMSLFGQPEKRDLYTNPNNSREFEFPKQGLRVYIVPSDLVGKPTAPNIFRPTPDDVVLSFQVSEPFPPTYSPRGVKWCGFTWRLCEPLGWR